MGIPQLISISLMCINLLLSAYQHGKKKTGEHSFWIALISTTLNFIILQQGGFFK